MGLECDQPKENLGFVQAPEPEVTWEKLGRGKGQAFPHFAAGKDKMGGPTGHIVDQGRVHCSVGDQATWLSKWLRFRNC